MTKLQLLPSLCALSLALLTFEGRARADLTPPGKVEAVIELTLQNQSAFPAFGFVVVDCWPAIPPGVGFARGNESVRCLPHGPISVYALPRADFDVVSARPPPSNALTVIAERGKSCGKVADEDTSFTAASDVQIANVTYALDADVDGGCKMHKISVTTETRAEHRARSLTSAVPTAPPSTIPSAATNDSPPPRSNCGACSTIARNDSATPALLASCIAILFGLGRRRASRRPFRNQ